MLKIRVYPEEFTVAQNECKEPQLPLYTLDILYNNCWSLPVEFFSSSCSALASSSWTLLLCRNYDNRWSSKSKNFPSFQPKPSNVSLCGWELITTSHQLTTTRPHHFRIESPFSGWGLLSRIFVMHCRSISASSTTT